MLTSIAWWIVDFDWEYNVDLRREMGMVPSFTLVEMAVSARTDEKTFLNKCGSPLTVIFAVSF